MAKKNQAVPLIVNLFIEMLTVIAAMYVIQYLNTIANNPACKDIEPNVRNTLLIYTYLVLGLTILSSIIILYILAKD